MKRLWRSRKALSPVVAAIILIAVTVAVSIAVAAWMGALTFTWMGYESLEISTVTWNPMASVDITVVNDGTRDVSVTAIKVNYVTAIGVTPALAGGFVITAGGDSQVFNVPVNYINGTAYDISVVTSSGYEFTDHFTGGEDVS